MKKHLVAIFFLSSHILPANADAITQTHCVTNAPNGVNVRLSPNPLNDWNIVTQIPNHTAVQELNRAKEWSNIAVSSESPLHNVYIASRFLTPIGDGLECR